MKTNIKSITGKIILLLISGLPVVNTALHAQGINEQVTVVAAFEPSVPEAEKLTISPSPDESAVKLPAMTYSVTPLQMETTLKPDDITAVKLVGEPQKKLYRNYAKVGLGNYTTPYAEFFAGSLRSKTTAFGIHMKHLSSSGTIKDYPKSSNSLNLVQLSGQQFTDNHTISAEAGYRRNVVHHYGFRPAEFDFPVDEDALRQRFNRLNASAGIKSNYTDPDQLNHRLSLAFNNISDLFETRESMISIKAAADKRFELFDLTDYQVLGFETNLDFSGYKDSTLKQKSALLSFKPSISTEFNEYKVLFGLDFTIQADSISKAYLFPFLEGQVRALEDQLVFTAGISGGIARKGFDELSDVNPFIQSALPLQYTREKFTFYAGARARAGKHVNLTASFRTSSVEGEAFFVNDPELPLFNRFTIVYNDGSVLKGRFEAEYQTAERILVKAFAGFEKWSLTNDEDPWHRPVSTFGADAYYDIQKKIIARAGFTSSGKQLARIPSADREEGFVAETVKGYTDLHLGVEYRYTKLLSAFLNFSNIFGTRYYQWYNYPGYRFQLMGGVSYSF
ncbi:MAG: hypothetical protein AB9834_13570 [Lentimicrobium sp.]